MRYALLGILVLLAGCQKDKEGMDEEKTAAQLLTQKEWVLAATGFDHNMNGVLDPDENIIEDCQKDNSYVFHISGTGSSLDNTISCGGPAIADFNWQLLNNDSDLEIEFERIHILRLNENEMMLSPAASWQTAKFMMVYRH
ncbi:MAG TPA: hypothetical protein VIZ28_05960 [Chitinophagaceae bacterium]